MFISPLKLIQVESSEKREVDRKPKTMGKDQKITAEDVITKLKDDGDFDRLRIKIIRQLKQNVLSLSLLRARFLCTITFVW